MAHQDLRNALAAGDFVFTAEIGPPASSDAEPIRAAARALAPLVHAANITDNQAATAKMSPLACAMVMLEEGLEPILQLTARDRNLLALQSELLGAWAIGVRTVLALGGDPLSVGPYGSTATHVRDVDSVGLARLIASLNAGVMAAGETIATPTGFLVVGAVNPLVDAAERIITKIEAGVNLLQTNIVFDVQRFAEWFAPIVASGILRDVPVLVGVTPPKSMRTLRHLHDRIPGVEVDGDTFARMDGLAADAALRMGIGVAADVVSRLRGVPGVSGVHLMAPGWTVEAVPRVLALTGASSKPMVAAQYPPT